MLGLDLAPAAAHRRRDRLGQLLELLVRHRPLVGRPHEPAQELLAVEALAPPAALEHRHGRLLDALVGGEALAAGLALAPAPHGVAGSDRRESTTRVSAELQ